MLMPNSSLVVRRNATAGGRPTLPSKLVSADVVGMDETLSALTARTLAMYWPE
ncbi:hypothetical protein [Streptomyces sp. NEAU-H3]|uniref:hypothetical protein n=1 Tax=Streptomyces sp. NEAU-H3 TaxID=2720636 RepID=UPI001ADBE120|nr:hypothetical protein [Streptomyces sp. NEAU-H3]